MICATILKTMTRISTFVFFDIETTGLPFQERNRTKITELCLLAVKRRDIEISNTLHPLGKLTLVLNPRRKIHPKVEILTGLTNEYLKYAPTFAQKADLINNFLKELPKPVCLVAHNGNTFDYKILLAECNDVRMTLPDDLLCVDTLPGFRKLLYDNSNTENSSIINNDDNQTVDEDIWPELNISSEDWQELDDVCMSLKDISFIDEELILSETLVKDNKYNKNDEEYHTKEFMEEKEYQTLKEKRCAMIDNIFGDSENSGKGGKNKEIKVTNKPKSKAKVTSKGKKGEFTLSGLYKRILNKDFVDAHRAEEDCYALLECVTAMKDNFLPWMDTACKRLTEIKPLVRR